MDQETEPHIATRKVAIYISMILDTNYCRESTCQYPPCTYARLSYSLPNVVLRGLCLYATESQTYKVNQIGRDHILS